MAPDTGSSERFALIYFFPVSPTVIAVNKLGAIHKGILIVVVDVVLTLTHRCNAVRGHRTGSNNSGAENYLRRKTN